MTVEVSFEGKFLKFSKFKEAGLAFCWIWLVINVIIGVAVLVYLMQSAYYDALLHAGLLIFGILNSIACGFLFYGFVNMEHLYLLPWLFTNYIAIPLICATSVILTVANILRFVYNQQFVKVDDKWIVFACFGYMLTGFGIYSIKYVKAVYKYFHGISSEQTINFDEGKTDHFKIDNIDT